jgi:hypothetical protein
MDNISDSTDTSPKLDIYVPATEVYLSLDNNTKLSVVFLSTEGTGGWKISPCAIWDFKEGESNQEMLLIGREYLYYTKDNTIIETKEKICHLNGDIYRFKEEFPDFKKDFQGNITGNQQQYEVNIQKFKSNPQYQ